MKESRPQNESHSNQDGILDAPVRPFHTISQLAELLEISELSLYAILKSDLEFPNPT